MSRSRVSLLSYRVPTVQTVPAGGRLPPQNPIVPSGKFRSSPFLRPWYIEPSIEG